MMWTITIFIRSYVERPNTPTFRHLTLTEPLLTASLPPKPQAAQRPPAQEQQAAGSRQAIQFLRPSNSRGKVDSQQDSNRL